MDEPWELWLRWVGTQNDRDKVSGIKNGRNTTHGARNRASWCGIKERPRRAEVRERKATGISVGWYLFEGILGKRYLGGDE